MARQYSSVASQTKLSSRCNSSTTTLSVDPFTSWPPNVSVSNPMTIIIDPDTALEEICSVTSYSGTNLVVVRGVDGSSPQEHNVGAIVKHGVSARDFAEPAAHIDNTTSAHGLTIANVTTVSNTQTLSNKSIDATTNTLTNIGNASIAAAAAITPGKVLGTAVTQADTGTVTSTMILDGTIVNGDINAAAAIAASKISGTAVTQADTGTVTSAMIADGTIVNADINASAAIATSKLAANTVTVGSTSVALGGTAATVTGLTLTSPVLNTPTLSGTVAGTASLSNTTLSSATLDAASTIGGVSGTTLSADHGAWNAYTPAIGGTGWSATTSIPTNCRWLLIGKTCFINFKIKWPSAIACGAGVLTVSLPYAARKVGTGLDMEVGSFIATYFDSTYYSFGSAYIPLTLTNYIIPMASSGISFSSVNFTSLAAGSWIAISGSYEVA